MRMASNRGRASRKVTAREGHQPMTPGGQPDASRRRQYSQRSNTACRMPGRSPKTPCQPGCATRPEDCESLIPKRVCRMPGRSPRRPVSLGAPQGLKGHGNQSCRARLFVHTDKVSCHVSILRMEKALAHKLGGWCMRTALPAG